MKRPWLQKKVLYLIKANVQLSEDARIQYASITHAILLFMVLFSFILAEQDLVL